MTPSEGATPIPPAQTTSEFAERLVASVSQMGSARTSPVLFRELLRLLARGAPVTIKELATAAGRPAGDVLDAVSRWRDTEYDREGRLIGWGITLRPTPHCFIVGGKQLYTWCALDTLFFPAVIGRPAHVESACPTTGGTIRLSVDPVDGISALDPPNAVVSIVVPEQMTSVRATFCNPGRFFANADAAQAWQAKYSGVSILSVADAYRESRPLSDALLETSEAIARCLGSESPSSGRV